MNKPKPDFGGMIGDLDLPEDPGEIVRSDAHTDEQSHNRTVKRSYDSATVRRPADRRRASRVKAEPKPEPADYVQRSLYAREETFERLRRFAFENRRPAQELYREGLFLLLKKYGLAEGIAKPEDV